MKGSCAFLGCGNLEVLVHSGENLLELLRTGDLTLTTSMTDALLSVVDNARTALTSIEATGNEPDENYTELVERLHTLQTGGDPEEAPAASAPSAEDPAPAPVAEPSPEPEPAAVTAVAPAPATTPAPARTVAPAPAADPPPAACARRSFAARGTTNTRASTANAGDQGGYN